MINSTVKGTTDKENKEKTKKQTLQPASSSHLNKGTENMRQQNTKAQEKNPQKLSDYAHPLPPPPTP